MSSEPTNSRPDTTDRGWIGVDLDGTLAQYTHWQGVTHIGEPVPAMMDRVKNWLAKGKTVKILTARANPTNRTPEDAQQAVDAITKWCIKHTGHALEVTCSKDLCMAELWDDRCVTVQKNTGRILTK